MVSGKPKDHVIFSECVNVVWELHFELPTRAPHD